MVFNIVLQSLADHRLGMLPLEPPLVQLLPEHTAHESRLIVYAGTSHHSKHGDKVGRYGGGREIGGYSHRRCPEHSNLAVRPGLFGGPFNRVISIIHIILKRPVPALAFEFAAHVLDHQRIPACGPHTGSAAEHILVVWRSFDSYGPRTLAIGEVDIGAELDAVAHWHHLLEVFWRPVLRSLQGIGLQVEREAPKYEEYNGDSDPLHDFTSS